jgi:FkbM family methyltransferase
MKTMTNQLSTPPIWVDILSTVINVLPAGRYRLMNQLCRGSKALFVRRMPKRLGGYAFTCDLRDVISREVCFTGGYEPQETALVRAILRSGASFVDVGANWGYFTLLASHLVGPQGRVLSLEPDPRLYARLQENLLRNHISHVKALPIAAADKPGRLTLAGYDENAGNFGLSSLVHRPKTPSQSFQVKSDSLDRILDAQRLDAVDLMKMDIEGAEAFALAAGYTAARIDHSLQTTRRLAYHHASDVEQILSPLDPSAPVDAWPHHLWRAPGISAL